MLDVNFGLGSEGAALYRRAASGELEAQRALAIGHLEVRASALRHGGLAGPATFEALFWCRLAAAHGDDTDAMRLCEALSQTANIVAGAGFGGPADDVTTEVLAILMALAERGHAEAAGTVRQTAADVSPVLLARARDMAARAFERNPDASL